MTPLPRSQESARLGDMKVLVGPDAPAASHRVPRAATADVAARELKPAWCLLAAPVGDRIRARRPRRVSRRRRTDADADRRGDPGGAVGGRRRRSGGPAPPGSTRPDRARRGDRGWRDLSGRGARRQRTTRRSTDDLAAVALRLGLACSRRSRCTCSSHSPTGDSRARAGSAPSSPVTSSVSRSAAALPRPRHHRDLADRRALDRRARRRASTQRRCATASRVQSSGAACSGSAGGSPSPPKACS